MAENSGFFDSIDSDRAYSAMNFNRLLNLMFANGVIRNQNWWPDNNEQLWVEKTAAMTVTVHPGRAVFNGQWYELTESKDITIEAASSALRYDAVYVHFDAAARKATVKVSKGTPGSRLPNYQRSWGPLLATILVGAGASQINTPEDMRADYTVCGFADMREAPCYVQEWRYVAPSTKTSVTSLSYTEIEDQIHESGSEASLAIYEFDEQDFFFISVNGIPCVYDNSMTPTPSAGRWSLGGDSTIRIGTDANPSKGDVVIIDILGRNLIGPL